jgi:hypothetical protein
LLQEVRGESGGIPHLAKNERDAPNFLYAPLDRTACAPFFKERRMKFKEPTKLHRKSGVWGTRRLAGIEPKARAEEWIVRASVKMLRAVLGGDRLGHT